MRSQIQLSTFNFQLSILLLFLPLMASAGTAVDSVPQRQLGEVVVTGSRGSSDVRCLPMTVNVVDRETLTEKRQTAILQTLSEQIPGLFVTQRGLMGYGASNGAAGGISLRGLSGGAGQMMVLIDGHPQYNGIYGHPIADAYHTMMADHVEVLRGPASMLYGSNAMGGVINIVTRGQQSDGVHTDISLGAGSYGTFQGEASNRIRYKRFASNVAVQYGRSDNHRPNMGFEQCGGHLNLSFDISANWRVFADADLTHYRASYPGSEDSPLLEADQWITRGVATAGVENHHDGMDGALSVYTNFGWHKINDGYGPGYHKNTPQTELFRSKDALTGVSLYETFRLFRGNHLTVGFDYQHTYGNAYYTSRATGEVVSGTGASGDNRGIQSTLRHINEVAGYVDFRQDLAHWVTIDAGVRFNYHAVSGNEWIPQGGVVFRPLRNGELKAMVSKGFRNPTVKEMFLFGSANEGLRPERIMNYELSWRHRLLGNALIYGVNVFYLKGDNMIQTVNRKNINTGAIENCGVEAEVSYSINKHWQLSTNHSFLRMRNLVLAAPKYKGYLGVRYSIPKFYAVLGVQHTGGLYTEVGSSERTTHFTLLNLTAAYHLNKTLTLWAKGDNLLWQRYEIIAGYPMPRATFMGGVNIRL